MSSSSESVLDAIDRPLLTRYGFDVGAGIYSVGYRLAEERVTFSVKFQNLANVDAQQHIFGDILKRQVLGDVRFRF